MAWTIKKCSSNLIFCKKLLRAHFAKYECGFGRSANAFLNVMTHEYGETLFIRYLFVLHMSHVQLWFFSCVCWGSCFRSFFWQKNVFSISIFPYLSTIGWTNSYYLSAVNLPQDFRNASFVIFFILTCFLYRSAKTTQKYNLILKHLHNLCEKCVEKTFQNDKISN